MPFLGKTGQEFVINSVCRSNLSFDKPNMKGGTVRYHAGIKNRSRFYNHETNSIWIVSLVSDGDFNFQWFEKSY